MITFFITIGKATAREGNKKENFKVPGVTKGVDPLSGSYLPIPIPGNYLNNSLAWQLNFKLL